MEQFADTLLVGEDAAKQDLLGGQDPEGSEGGGGGGH